MKAKECRFDLKELQRRCPLPGGWTCEKAEKLYLFTVRLYEGVCDYVFTSRRNPYLMIRNQSIILKRNPKEGHGDIVTLLARKYDLSPEDVEAYLDWIGSKVKDGWNITDWWLELRGYKSEPEPTTLCKINIFGNKTGV